MIPERPLNFRPIDLSIDDQIWLQEWVESNSVTPDDLRTFKRIMASCSDWTEEEIGKLTFREIPQVFAQMGQSADPLAKTASSSNSGPAESVASSPAG